MQAVQVIEAGQIEIRDVPEPPAPGPGRVTVRVARVALNHLDLYSRRGMAFARRRLPLTLGVECMGVVAAVGSGVTSVSPGARVAVFPVQTCGACKFCRVQRENLCLHSRAIMGFHVSGCLQELVDVSAGQVLRVPDNVSDAAAACAPITCATVEHMLFDNADLQRGETILVQAGGSGIGSTAIQMAKAAGAIVLTTVGSRDKEARARALGADLVINYREAVFSRLVDKFTDRRGVDVVFEHVGVDTWEQSLRCLGKGGRLVICGSTTGVSAPTNLMQLFNQQIRILASFGGSLRNIATSLHKISTAQIAPVIAAELPYQDVERGLDMLASRNIFGKVIIRVGA